MTEKARDCSIRARKPSAIRVIVSRFSASLADSEGEDGVLLLEDEALSSPTSDDDERSSLHRTQSTPPDRPVMSLSVYTAAEPTRRSSTVTVRRALCATVLDTQLTRVNSFLIHICS